MRVVQIQISGEIGMSYRAEATEMNKEINVQAKERYYE